MQLVLWQYKSSHATETLHILYLRCLIIKPTKWPLHPAKTLISLGIHPIWSESSLSAWRNSESSATQWAHCKDWSNWVDAQADLSLHWAHISFCWFFHEAAHFWKQRWRFLCKQGNHKIWIQNIPDSVLLSLLMSIMINITLLTSSSRSKQFCILKTTMHEPIDPKGKYNLHLMKYGETF